MVWAQILYFFTFGGVFAQIVGVILGLIVASLLFAFLPNSKLILGTAVSLIIGLATVNWQIWKTKDFELTIGGVFLLVGLVLGLITIFTGTDIGTKTVGAYVIGLAPPTVAGSAVESLEGVGGQVGTASPLTAVAFTLSVFVAIVANVIAQPIASKINKVVFKGKRKKGGR